MVPLTRYASGARPEQPPSSKTEASSRGTVAPARSSRHPPAVPIGDPRSRVHIAAIGFEVERVTDAIEQDRADRVYLLSREGSDVAAPFVAAVERRLRALPWPPAVQRVTADIWDLFDCLAAYRRIFAAEHRLDRRSPRSAPVRVNVSTGTKVTAIAGMLACMLWNGEPYYVRVSKAWYSGRVPRLRAVNDIVDRVDPIGVYELRTPAEELVEVLEALQRRGGSLRKFELIRELGLDRPNGTLSKPISPQACHGRLRRRLAPLEEKWGFIRSGPGGPRGRIVLTEQGRLALVLFGHSRDR